MSEMRLYTTLGQMKQARKQLGSPAALDEALVATGVDALFVLLEGGTIEMPDGRKYRLSAIKGDET